MWEIAAECTIRAWVDEWSNKWYLLDYAITKIIWDMYSCIEQFYSRRHFQQSHHQ